MAKATSEPKARKARTRQPKYFRISLHGRDEPLIVVAMTKKSATQAAMVINEATHTDLMMAGKDDWGIIDLTAQLSIVREATPVAA